MRHSPAIAALCAFRTHGDRRVPVQHLHVSPVSRSHIQPTGAHCDRALGVYVCKKPSGVPIDATAQDSCVSRSVSPIVAVVRDGPDLRMTRTIHNPALRSTITFLTTAKESHGAITELEVMVMPGGKNPPHYHKTYDEAFEVIEGVLRLDLKQGLRRELSAGQSYVVKAGEVHSFLNETPQPARIRTRIVPGNEGFENSVRILAGLALEGLNNNRLKVPRSLRQLAVCLAMSDTWLPGVLSPFNLPLRLLARFARRRGIENALLLRYAP